MKKVLIVCYYWPPAGGPGVQRWLKFATYLTKFGIDPIIYTPENPNYPIVDTDTLNELPHDIKVIKFPIKEPYAAANLLSRKKTKTISKGIINTQSKSFISSLMLFVRGNFFIPDARVGWVKPSVTFLKKFLKTNSVDAVITTGPPHSLHLIGQILKEKIGVKWIADFRDPWTTIHYHKSLKLLKISAKKHKRLESEVLNAADHILVTSPTTKEEFSNITRQPITVITNGYEPDKLKTPKLSEKFTIAHIGSLLAERNPKNLWLVLAEIIKENKNFAKDLELVFAGAISDEVISALRETGLYSISVFKGYVTHSEAKLLQRSSQILLLLEIDSLETRAIIPGKLFEYLQAKRPIMAIGPEGSDISEILKETQSGVFIKATESSVMKEKIVEYYNKFKSNKLAVSDADISNYSRENLTGKLASVIKKVANE